MAAAVLVLAGSIAIVSGLIGWATFTFPSTATTSRSVSAGHPKLAMILGAFLILRGVLTRTLDPRSARRWGGLAVVSGGILGGFAIDDLATEKARLVTALVSNTARGLHLPVAQVRTIIDRQVAGGSVRLAFQPGTYLALLAAALAIVGAVLAWLALRGVSGTTRVPLPPAVDPSRERADRTAGLNIEGRQA